MELYQLEQFVAVAESGSMMAASERLFISRSAISQNLKRLEQELDCQLFRREHNRLEITPFGKIVLEGAKSIMQVSLDMQTRIDAEKRQQRNEVRVAHFSQPLCYFKMPHLAKSLLELSFDVTLLPERDALEGLMDGAFDIAIVSDRVKLPAGCKTYDLEREQACVSVPETSSLFECGSISIGDLSDQKLMITDNLLGASEWYNQLAEAIPSGPAELLVVPADEYLTNMSESDFCHFSTTQMVGFFGLGHGRRAVPITDSIAKRSILLVTRDGNDDRVGSIVRYLKSSDKSEFDAYDIFPFLLFPGQIDNLTMGMS